MRMSDWISDGCSSDLDSHADEPARLQPLDIVPGRLRGAFVLGRARLDVGLRDFAGAGLKCELLRGEGEHRASSARRFRRCSRGPGVFRRTPTRKVMGFYGVSWG